MKIFWSLVLTLVCILGAILPATTASANTTWAHEGWTKVGNWTLGGDIRIRWLRTQDMCNMGTPGFVAVSPTTAVPLGAWNNVDIWRERGRLWVKADLPKKITTYFRMTQEIRWGESARGLPSNVVYGNEDRWALILDNAWMRVAEPFDLPITLKGGRMDMRYGQCWLICDSDSTYNGDGSRTYFFDAIVATLHLNALSTNVDFIYSKVHEDNFQLASDDEDLYGVYATITAAKPVKIEAYMLSRNQRQQRVENVMYALGVGINHPMRQVYTYGARLSGKWGGFSFAAEGAFQNGTIDNIGEFWIANTVDTPGVPKRWMYKVDENGNNRTGSMDILAYAGYAHAGYDFKDVFLKPTVRLGFWFYSGDNRTSSKWGGWDDYYGQAPLHGEYYLYSNLDLLSSPNSDWDPFYNTNVYFPKLVTSIVPYDNLKFTVTYQAMFAQHNTQPTYITDSQGGTFRGHYVMGILGYVFSEHLECHIRWEGFFPGDYYAANATNAGQFGRVEFLARF